MAAWTRAPQVGQICADGGELVGEIVSAGAVFGDVPHACAVVAERLPVCVVEDVAGMANSGVRADGVGVEVGEMNDQAVVLFGVGG